MATFKYKPHRLKYISNIDTLECKHYQYLQEFKNRRDKKEQIKKKIELYSNQLNNTGKTNVDGALKVKLKNDINKLQKEYDDINNCVDELEYFSKTHDTIFDYYDIIDKHNEKNNINKKIEPINEIVTPKQNSFSELFLNNELLSNNTMFPAGIADACGESIKNNLEYIFKENEKVGGLCRSNTDMNILACLHLCKSGNNSVVGDGEAGASPSDPGPKQGYGKPYPCFSVQTRKSLSGLVSNQTYNIHPQNYPSTVGNEQNIQSVAHFQTSDHVKTFSENLELANICGGSIQTLHKDPQLSEQIYECHEDSAQMSINLNKKNVGDKCEDVCSSDKYVEKSNELFLYDDDNITSEINNKIISKQEMNDAYKLEKLNLLSQNKRKVKKIAKKRLRNNDITNNNKSIIDYFINNDINNDINKLNIDKKIDENNIDNKINITNHENKKNEIKIESIENFKKNDYENNTNRATLLTEYLDLLDFSRADNKIRISNIKSCPKCKKDKIIIYSDGIYVCTKCGDIEQILVNSDLSNYKDCLQEKPAYPYKRLNHFCEWLSQFQAKESTDIPDSIYEKIYDELKKNSITKNNKITPKKMKEILKKLRLHQYYEHIPHIISRITGKPPPTISRETEEKLKIMFRDIQAPFAKHCPPERINFLSYSYVLHKFCQLLELDEFIKCFPLLKSREKLRLQDRLWKDICRELKWQFYPSI